ncbi:MAG TPA: RelA/SpoT family protein [Bacteroidales bacterium]
MTNTELEQERLEILRRYKVLIELWETRKDTVDRWMVRKAFRLAADAHKDMRRKTGEPFIYHPIEVATIAASEIGLGRTAIISALLHDTVEDTEIRLSEIRGMFGDEVAKIIDGLTKIDEISDSTSTAQAETLKKILFTLTDDVRVILIKLADRLHNMRTLESMTREKQLKTASETLYIYAPLAYRLGLYAVKSELEELSFKYSQPEIYRDIKEKMLAKKEFQKEFFDEFSKPISKELKKLKQKFSIVCTPKTAYSIWQKMRNDEIPFEEIDDTFAVDIIIDAEPTKEKLECWAAYSVITSIYLPNNKKFQDWISTPKANGYAAIHITVMGPQGHWVEVHIRSKRMDEVAKKGYAAHWKQKENGSNNAGLEEWLGTTRELLNESDEQAIDFINDFKKNLFSDEIIVFTPKGKIVNLPIDATVLDFAYSIHTDLGNQCIGANINHRLMPIDYQLKSGDQIEIITSKIQQPNERWFNYVVTARAKSRIKNALKNERKKFREAGREKLSNFFEQLKLENSKVNINKLIKEKKTKGRLDLYHQLATDKITLKEVKEILLPQETIVSRMRNFMFPFSKPKTIDFPKEIATENKDKQETEVAEGEAKELEYAVSRCCNPIPGDDVIGLVFPGEPIQIHRTDCNVAIKLMSQYGKNIVKAKWKQQEGIVFLAGLTIKAVDKIGLIQTLTKMISEEFQLNIRSFNLESVEGLVDITVKLYVNNTEKLKHLIQRLKSIKEIIKVTRIDKIG